MFIEEEFGYRLFSLLMQSVRKQEYFYVTIIQIIPKGTLSSLNSMIFLLLRDL